MNKKIILIAVIAFCCCGSSLIKSYFEISSLQAILSSNENDFAPRQRANSSAHHADARVVLDFNSTNTRTMNKDSAIVPRRTANSSAPADATVLLDSTRTNTRTTLDPFTQCMLRVEKELLTQSQIDQWDADMVPIPYSVKIIDNRFYIVNHLMLPDPRSKLLVYTCNGRDGRGRSGR